jgi:hypothetical protein
MNLVDSVHGRVDPTTIPVLDAKAAAEGRPTTPIYKVMLREKEKRILSDKK